MRRNSIFWGTVVVLLGAIMLAANLKLITGNVWSFFWPGLIILLGIWFLLGPSWRTRNLDTIQSAIPLEASTSAEIDFHHGAGRLEVNASARPGELINGWFTGGVTSEIHRNDGVASLKLQTPSDVAFHGPWPGGSHGYEWVVGVTSEIPVKLAFHTGASESVLDLSGLKVTNLSVETGASSSVITLPANAGFTNATIKSGVASVKVHIPAGVGANIHVKSGLSGLNIDPSRFTRDGDGYLSADYSSALNKVDLFIETGIGSVDIN